jgi:LacI family transcriptional regulator
MRVVRNRLHPPERRATIRDIAAASGVSVATVSRVLNNRNDVAPTTRARVLRAIHEEGYSANRIARGLSGRGTGLVAVTLPQTRSSYFSVLADSVADALYEHDLRAVLCPTRHEHEREAGLLERLLRGTTDGAILILPSESSEELLAVRRRHPLVVLDPKTPLEPVVPSVSAANVAGAEAATAHLLGLGHRRIAAVTGPSGWCATEERLAGYRAALVAAGVRTGPELQVEADFEIAGGRAAGRRLLGLAAPPTAIVAFNDKLAVGVLEAAREAGLPVPAGLSIVGFDDTDEAAVVTPRLTTVRQPLREMARMAAELLTLSIAGRLQEGPAVQLATHLVVRESTAPAPLTGSGSRG